MRLRFSPNCLLLFVPVSVLLERMDGISPALVFFAAALAIVPAARLIVAGTEQIASRTGDAVGGLLNATFGNLPEPIIALMALQAGLHDIARASIIGAILANLLLAVREVREVREIREVLRSRKIRSGPQDLPFFRPFA